jgi:hypothetical protein
MGLKIKRGKPNFALDLHKSFQIFHGASLDNHPFPAILTP